MNYRIDVGNIRTVYSGDDAKEARKHYEEYCEQSHTGYGRASYEQVTMMINGELHKEFHPRLLVPTITELSALIRAIKKTIHNDYRAYEDDERPGILLTIGCSYDKSWNYQTGDNSFTGGAYGHPYWGVGAIYRNSNSVELAKEIIEDCRNQLS